MRAFPWKKKIALGAAVCSGLLFLACSHHAPPWDVPFLLGKMVAAPVLRVVYSEDEKAVGALCATYYHGSEHLPERAPAVSWRAADRRGKVHSLGGSGLEPFDPRVSFVFESPDAWYLKDLVLRYRLRQLLPPGGDEYGRMLALFRWIGTRWDHGADPVPGGLVSADPADIIEAGERGSRFWCEVCARVTVQAATAMGWPARLVTASSDGYLWEHALAEVWSNQFNKWLMVDTDYNILYEVGGRPLSAWEVCHKGQELQRDGLLSVRRFAPLKRGLQEADLLPLYRYVHIDLRNDWLSRSHAPGSPASGDLATWWTARSDLGPLLTAKIRVDSQSLFDWPVNKVQVHATEVREVHDGTYRIGVALRGYSPYFRGFLIRSDGGAWRECPGGTRNFVLKRGRHLIEARVVTLSGDLGPMAGVRFVLR